MEFRLIHATGFYYSVGQPCPLDTAENATTFRDRGSATMACDALNDYRGAADQFTVEMVYRVREIA